MQQFLHVGCGSKRKAQTTIGFNTPQWTEIRFDIDDSVAPDVQGTMTDMSAVASESVDAIFSSHNIEHLYPHEVPVALKEFWRVLKSDGIAVITCPDLQSVCALVADNKLTQPAYQSPAGPITPLDILYGHRASMQRGNLYMAHRCGFTKDVLLATLQQAGFASVATLARPRFFDLWAFASKQPLNQEQLTQLAQTHGVL
jgi:predicted SAM-dependent methyltransferase